jgi:1,4-alpha-glucan branching enzyme
VVEERCAGAVTIAEESTAWPGVSRPIREGGLGFCYKWNMGWMHDTLRYMEHDPVHRHWHHNDMTFGLLYAFSEKLHPSAVARRSGVRKAFADRQDAG